MVRRGRHRIEVAAVFAVLVSSSPALAVISQQFFLSETNKLYYVVAANPSSGSFAAQITSIMMTERNRGTRQRDVEQSS